MEDELAVILADGVTVGFTLMVTVFEVAGFPETQAPLEVITQLIKSLLISALLVYVVLFVPTFVPFFFH
jgi:hypothetical protein